MKMPRYLTEGGPKRRVPASTYSADLCSGVTSAHQYHGDTPMACDISYRPYAVPRRSLPTITSALETPGQGCDTVAIRNVSQRPRNAATSSLPFAINCSSSAFLPKVPTSTTGRDGL